MRVLGLDIGEKRIGVAVSDPSGGMALPSQVILRTRLAADHSAALRADLARIVDLVRRSQAERVIVGLPLSLNGRIGPQAQRVLAFCRQIEAVSPVPVLTWDERLSTAEAEQALVQAGVSRKKRRARVDASAAAVMLQGYLDSLRQPNV